jgi:hypothetical protein
MIVHLIEEIRWCPNLSSSDVLAVVKISKHRYAEIIKMVPKHIKICKKELSEERSYCKLY